MRAHSRKAELRANVERCQFTCARRGGSQCGHAGAVRTLSGHHIKGKALLCDHHAALFRRLGFKVAIDAETPARDQFAATTQDGHDDGRTVSERSISGKIVRTTTVVLR